MGFRIDLVINNSIKAFITFHSQTEEPFKNKETLFLTIFTIPLPLKQYHSIYVRGRDIRQGFPYYILKDNQLIEGRDDPLIKCLIDVNKPGAYMRKYSGLVGKKSTRIRHFHVVSRSFSSQHLTSVNIRNHLKIIPSEEVGSMVLEHESFLVLKMKNNKKKQIPTGYTSFYGLYDYLLTQYNSIISQLDRINR